MQKSRRLGNDYRYIVTVTVMNLVDQTAFQSQAYWSRVREEKARNGIPNEKKELKLK